MFLFISEIHIDTSSLFRPELCLSSKSKLHFTNSMLKLSPMSVSSFVITYYKIERSPGIFKSSHSISLETFKSLQEIEWDDSCEKKASFASWSKGLIGWAQLFICKFSILKLKWKKKIRFFQEKLADCTKKAILWNFLKQLLLFLILGHYTKKKG